MTGSDLDRADRCFSVQSVEYYACLDDTEEVTTFYHYAVEGDTKHMIDWTRYHRMSADDFQLWLDLDRPGRRAAGIKWPLDPNELQKMKETRDGR